MNPDKPPQDGTILTTLQGMRKGVFLADLEDSISEVVAAVRATNKAGRLTLKVEIAPASKDNAEILRVEDDITLKLPKPAKGASIFYPDEANRLHRHDPGQRELEFKTLPQEPQQPVKSVSNG